MQYTHTQRGPLFLLLIVLAAAAGVAAWVVRFDAMLFVAMAVDSVVA